MTIYSIYKATNIINNKVYIGFTNNFEKRLIAHKSAYTRKNTKFYNAIKKYEWDSFVWEIIYQSLDSNHCLNIMEPFFIVHYNSINEGYNTSSGGNCGPILLGSSNGMYGKTHSRATKKLIAENTRKNLKGRSYDELYGKARAAEIRKFRSSQLSEYLSNHPEARLGAKNPNSKKFKVISPENIEYIVEDSIKSFCKQHNIDVGSIINVAKQRINNYKGWKAEYIINS